MFFISFTKGNPQIHVPFSGGCKYSNRVYSSRKEFAPRGDPFEKGGKEKENSRMASSESIFIRLNSVY